MVGSVDWGWMDLVGTLLLSAAHDVFRGMLNAIEHWGWSPLEKAVIFIHVVLRFCSCEPWSKQDRHLRDHPVPQYRRRVTNTVRSHV